jgi:hypothetical protein
LILNELENMCFRVQPGKTECPVNLATKVRRARRDQKAIAATPVYQVRVDRRATRA